MDSRKVDVRVALSNLGIYYVWENIKNSYGNNKFEISGST